MRLKMFEVVGDPEGLTEAFQKWHGKESAALSKQNISADESGSGRVSWFLTIDHTNLSAAFDGHGRSHYTLAVFYEVVNETVIGRELTHHE